MFCYRLASASVRKYDNSAFIESPHGFSRGPPFTNVIYWLFPKYTCEISPMGMRSVLSGVSGEPGFMLKPISFTCPV